MNTPAHLILGAAAFSSPDRRGSFRAAVLGALAPDVSLYVMASVSIFVLGISPNVVFRDYYYSDAWQSVFAVDNSFVLWGAVFIVALLLRRPLHWQLQARRFFISRWTSRFTRTMRASISGQSRTGSLKVPSATGIALRMQALSARSKWSCRLCCRCFSSCGFKAGLSEAWSSCCSVPSSSVQVSGSFSDGRSSDVQDAACR